MYFSITVAIVGMIEALASVESLVNPGEFRFDRHAAGRFEVVRWVPFGLLESP